MNNIRLYGLMGLCLLFAALFIFKSCELQKVKTFAEKARMPDTVYVAKPYKVIEIKKEYIEKPIKVLVYQQDTTLRKQVEQSDIITGITYKSHNLFQKMDFIKVDKINPKGIVFSNEYQTPALREIKIDLHGNVQIKKKKHIELKIFAGALFFGTGLLIYQQIQK